MLNEAEGRETFFFDKPKRQVSITNFNNHEEFLV